MYIYVCMYVCIYIYVHICMYMYIHTYIHMMQCGGMIVIKHYDTLCHSMIWRVCVCICMYIYIICMGFNKHVECGWLNTRLAQTYSVLCFLTRTIPTGKAFCCAMKYDALCYARHSELPSARVRQV